MTAFSLARTSNAVGWLMAASAYRTGRTCVSMPRRWLTMIPRATGSPAGSATLVGHGRTREVIGQTPANPACSGSATD